MGGYAGSSNYYNDVWRSTDNGLTWTRVIANAAWSPRYGHRSVVVPDGSIVIIGGLTGAGNKNDSWQSWDSGVTWTNITGSPGWRARSGHTCVALSDGSIVLMGGYTTTQVNDTWRSVDNGITWSLMNASSGWTARSDHTSVAMPDGSIVLMGGSGNNNNVWRSTDKGATWTQMTAGAEWSVRYAHNSVAVPDGSIVLIGGYDTTPKKDVWRSTNNGATWTNITGSPGWSARSHLSSVAMRDGSIVLMGGYAGTGIYNNNVWRLNPVGSSAQNPSHTYNEAGNYQVSLQAYNAGGYNSTRKAGFITAIGITPVANFTANVTKGAVPLAVQFNDTSLNTPISWFWDFGDGTNSTLKSPVHIFAAPGIYTVSLNSSNTGGSDWENKTGFITVSNPPVVTNVVLSSASGYNRTSDNLTVTWTSSDPDGDPVKNITTWYRNGTPFTVLNMPFEGGSTTTFTRDYSGYNRNGTVNGTAWNSTGGYGGSGAYYFDGVDDHIDVGTFNPPDPMNVTLSAWVNVHDRPVSSTNGYILTKGNDAAGNSYGIFISGSSSTTLSAGLMTFSSGAPSGRWASSAAGSVTPDTWHHIVGVLHGQTMKIYLDGELKATNTASGIINPSAQSVWIGGQNRGGLPYRITGFVDEVQMYNRSLSDQEISVLYQGRRDLIVPKETQFGDIWQVSITPNDGYGDGVSVISNILQIQPNHLPSAANVLLTSSSSNNLTSDNLTLSWTVSDPDQDPVNNITNWYRNGEPFAVLNMPFREGPSTHARDYSGYGNNGTVIGAIWQENGGRNFSGAYQFDGNGHIDIPSSSSLDIQRNLTLEGWFNIHDTYPNSQPLLGKGNATYGQYGMYRDWYSRKLGFYWNWTNAQQNTISDRKSVV
jgi:PKD repeat protein